MTTLESDQAKIRGWGISSLYRYVNAKAGSRGIDRVLGALGPRTRGYLEPEGIQGRAWYTYSAYAEVFRAIDQTLGEGDLELCREVGHFASREDAGTIFKIVALFSSPGVLLSRGSLFWRQYCNQGSFEVEKSRSGAIGSLVGFPDVAPEHCHLLAGWIEQMSRTCGAKSVRVVKFKCVHQKDEACKYQVNWV